MPRDLDRLEADALLARARPYLSHAGTPGWLAVDVASGVSAEHPLASRTLVQLRKATFHCGRQAYKRVATWRTMDRLDAEELATAVASSVGVKPPEVYRASPTELYTATLPPSARLGLDLPDLPTDELRSLLAHFGVTADVAEAELSTWAQTALLERSTAGQRLQLVDALTGTPPRHPGEWAIARGDIVPVGYPDAWTATETRIARPGPSEVDTLRHTIASHEPTFGGRHRGWYQQMMSVLA